MVAKSLFILCISQASDGINPNLCTLLCTCVGNKHVAESETWSSFPGRTTEMCFMTKSKSFDILAANEDLHK